MSGKEAKTMERKRLIEAIDEWYALKPQKKGWLTRWARPHLISGFNLFIQRVERGLSGYGRWPDA